MTDDLIARLRWWGEHGVSGSLNDLVEAADRIEALETEAAENARIIGMSAEREMALRGEIERLRKLAKDNNSLARMYKAQADEFRQKYVAALAQMGEG